MRRHEPNEEQTGLNPTRALLHPAWLAALGVLVLNDHVLKEIAALAPLAGKLSDFAGLVVAPVLLAALLGVRRRRGLIASAGLVGAVFAAINLSPAAAGVWDQTMATVGFPWATHTDPTDCLALVMLPATVAFFEPRMRRAWRRPRRRLAAFALAGIGTFACAASTGPGPGPTPTPTPVSASFQSRVALLNKTNELQIVQIRKLADDVNVDCERVAEAPQEYLTADAFGDPVRWELSSGQQIGLSGDLRQLGRARSEPLSSGECRAARLVVDIAPDIVVFWDGSTPSTSFVQHPEGDKEDLGGPQTVALTGDYSAADEDDVTEFGEGPCVRQRRCAGEQRRQAAAIPDGAEYNWEQQGDNRLFFEIPSRTERDRDEVPRRCRRIIEQPGLAWEPLPEVTRVVEALERGADGCHQLTLAIPSEGGDVPEPERYVVCAPWDALSPMMPRGEDYQTKITTDQVEYNASGRLEFEVEVYDATDAGQLVSRRRIDLIYGTNPSGMGVSEVNVVAKEGCGPIPAKCGQIDVPGEGRVGTEGQPLEVGEATELPSGETLHLIRALERPVRRKKEDCEDDPFIRQTMPRQPSSYFEAAIVDAPDEQQ